jgi:hypothetical protein
MGVKDEARAKIKRVAVTWLSDVVFVALNAQPLCHKPPRRLAIWMLLESISAPSSGIEFIYLISLYYFICQLRAGF